MESHAPQQKQRHILGPPQRTPLLVFLKSHGEISEPHVLIELGAVYVNKLRVTDPTFLVDSTSIIRIHSQPKRYVLDRPHIRSRVVAENEHFIIVDKPSQLPVHPTLDNLRENLLAAFDEPVFVTHRLDVPTSGLVLIAKTKSYQRVFNQIIYEGRVEKLYEAQIDKRLALGNYVHYMEKSLRAPKVLRKSLSPELNAEMFQECLLEVLAVEGPDPSYRAKIRLRTGRTHQIRSQLAFEGCPILGDELYGGRDWPYFGLRATDLAYHCPVLNQSLSFQLTSLKTNPNSISP